MSMLQEFKAFAVNGNVIDLAVAVIIGAAFGKIVDSLVQRYRHADRRHDLRQLRLQQLLYPAESSGSQPTAGRTRKSSAPFSRYGNFITIALNFLILAFTIFQMVRILNKLKKAESAAPETTPEDIQLLREIRDSLKK